LSATEGTGAYQVPNRSRTTARESRLPETLNTFDSPPRLSDEEIALIDETGAKEHHRFFVRVIIVWNCGFAER